MYIYNITYIIYIRPDQDPRQLEEDLGRDIREAERDRYV